MWESDIDTKRTIYVLRIVDQFTVPAEEFTTACYTAWPLNVSYFLALRATESILYNERLA